MDAIEVIKAYLSGEISSALFQNELFHNNEIEKILSENIKIPPYTNSGSVFLYLIENDILSPSGELNCKDLLSKFLSIKDINFVFDDAHKENY
ncbi:hypothetical protein GCB14_22485, partial [Salmonella enterica]|nr:hypothetical protein [Salmonella enterica]